MTAILAFLLLLYLGIAAGWFVLYVAGLIVFGEFSIDALLGAVRGAILWPLGEAAFGPIFPSEKD